VEHIIVTTTEHTVTLSAQEAEGALSRTAHGRSMKDRLGAYFGAPRHVEVKMEGDITHTPTSMNPYQGSGDITLKWTVVTDNKPKERGFGPQMGI
jgi:hypothetical protein